MTATVPAELKPGFEFTHKHTIDPWWKPAPGEKYSTDGRKARCVVTAVRINASGRAGGSLGRVYMTYVRPDGTRAPGSWYAFLSDFIKEYCS